MPTIIELNEPNNSGTISEGESADFILLDQHPIEVSSDELNNISVVETWHDGKRVYSL